MAFFAVIGKLESSFEVLQCHINLWCLGGLLGHKNFVCDIGLRLRGNDAATLDKIQLALPFGTTEDAAEDLHDRLMHPQTAELVFGNPVTIADNEITYNERAATLGQVDSFRRVKDKCGPDCS